MKMFLLNGELVDICPTCVSGAWQTADFEEGILCVSAFTENVNMKQTAECCINVSCYSSVCLCPFIMNSYIL